MNPGVGNFLSSESLVLVSGPATLDSDTTLTTNWIPIGLVQNFQVQQQKQVKQMFEIGSRKPFFIPGRTMTTASISRVMFDGPSLMYAMYMQGLDPAGGGSGSKVKLPPWSTKSQASGVGAGLPTEPADALEKGEAILGDNSANSSTTPGFFFSNLASSFFNLPLGLGVILHDMEMQPYGGVYLEECYIQSHAFSASSQQTVLVENVSLRCASMRPIQASSMA
jgi:hypothetical protein